MEFIFAGAIGVYADDYEETEDPDPEEPADLNKCTIEVMAPDGMTAALGESFTPPPAVVLDENGSAVTAEYTVSVKDASGGDVTLTDNAFTPGEIGAYTITYTIDGTDTSAQITVQC